MRWFLRASWDGIRSWGFPMALGCLLYDLLFARNPPTWPMYALIKYSLFVVVGGVGMGLFRARRASVQRGRDAA